MNNHRNTEHPLWDIYDEYRTARLNVKINQYKLDNAKRTNFIFEFMLAFAASSTVASLWIWQNVYGQYAWKGLLVVTAILAILKPLINPTDKIQKFSEILMDFKNLDHEYKKLTYTINQEKRYNETIKAKFQTLFEQKRFIDQKSNDSSIRDRKKIEFEKQVNHELPPQTFFIPGDYQ